MIRFLLCILRFLLCGCTVLLLIFLLIPAIANHYLPSMLADRGLENLVLRLDSFTPWHLRGTITAGDPAGPGLGAGFEINSTPTALLAGRVNDITLTGVTLHTIITDGKLAIEGFTLPDTKKPEDSGQRALPSLPIMVEKVVLREARLLIERDNVPPLPLLISGDLALYWHRDDRGSYRPTAATAWLASPGPAPAEFQISLDLQERTVRAEATGHIQDLQELAATLRSLPDTMQLAGSCTLEVSCVFSPGANRLESLRANFSTHDLLLNGPGIALQATDQSELLLAVSGDSEQLAFTVDNLQLTAPLPAFTRLSGTFHPSQQSLTGTATVTSPALTAPLQLDMTGTANGTTRQLELRLTGQKQSILLPQSPEILFDTHRLSAHLATDGTTTSLQLETEIDRINLPASDLILEGIRANVTTPLGSNRKATDTPGEVSVDTIRYHDEPLAALTATLSPTDDALEIAGRLTAKRDRHLRLDFTGHAGGQQPLTMDFRIPRTPISHRSLPRFITLPKGLNFSGMLTGSGTISSLSGLLGGTATLALANGSLDLDDSKVHLKGITTELTFPRLPVLASSPSQTMTIAEVQAGNLHLSDGLVTFRVEDTDSLFIEQSRIGWCGGKVESGSLRLSLAKPELATTLYCDRLQFSDLLDQLGITDAEGKGSLNGRLPVAFDGRRLNFDDGFLFSTPGDGGIVRFNNTAVLRQGLPNTGQAAHLDYTMQAMENFAYNWTKLTFNSRGDDLLITMQIDGKPATPLPFGYQGGQMVKKVEGSGIQHPIQLDVNFHLPFAQMFKYGRSIQQMMNK